MAIGYNNQWKPEQGDSLIGKFSPAHETARQHLTVCAVVKENIRMRQAIKDARLHFFN
jgi:hypothetical protein